MPLSDVALEPLLRLSTVPGFGPHRLSQVIRHFGSAERALERGPAEAGKLPGFGPELVRRLARAGGPEGARRAEAAIGALDRVGAVVLTPDDRGYPPGFRDIVDPPFVLFAIGRIDLALGPAVGVVGTRTPTRYGRDAARTFSRELAEAGFRVVSGMARGIDGAAQEACLDVGVGTVGVLGQGIDGIYPRENRTLFERVRREGLLLSEFPPGEEPRAGNFPRRNRLIAGLSLGVLVVEMGLRSGAQHTVNYALEQGKEVFAVPGPIGSPVSDGTNQMIKDGANVVTAIDDILDVLAGVGTTHAPPAPPGKRTAQPVPRDLPPEQARLLAALHTRTLHIDDLAAKAGVSTRNALTALLAMELDGLVDALPGKHYRSRGP